jgi:hypothetical protein
MYDSDTDLHPHPHPHPHNIIFDTHDCNVLLFNLRT